MTPLSEAFDHSTFRRALRDLLNLSPGDLRALAEIEFDDMDSVAEAFAGLDLLSDDTEAPPAALFLRLNSDESPEAFVREIRQLAADHPEFEDVDFSAIEESLLAFLVPGKDTRRNLHIRKMQHSVFPTMESAELTVDLRVVHSEDGKTRLVPVVVARMWFDEPVLTSNAAISFQIDEKVLTRLKEAVDRALALGSTVAREFDEWML